MFVILCRVLTGWAAPEEGQSLDEIPANLQAAEYRYVPLPECTAAHGNDDEGRPRVTDNNICAIDVNENGNTACNVCIFLLFTCIFVIDIEYLLIAFAYISSIRVILVAQSSLLYHRESLFKDLSHGMLAVDQILYQAFSHDFRVTLTGFGNKFQPNKRNMTCLFIKLELTSNVNLIECRIKNWV